MTDNKQLVSIAEFAARWDVHYHTVRAWLRRGMPGTRVGRTVIVVQPAADDWVKLQLDDNTSTFSIHRRDAKRMLA